VTLCQDVDPVKVANCLIKKVLERVFVASNKKVLEIIETYHHWQPPGGGKDEADDATAAGGSGENSESISAQQLKKGLDLERAGGGDRIQSGVCATSTAPTWSADQAGQTLVVSRCAGTFAAQSGAVL